MFTKETPTNLLIFLAALCLTADHIQAFPSCYSKQDGTLLQIADSCTSYIYCLSEKPITLTCPSGMGFSAKARGCVQYSLSDCVENSQSVQITNNFTKITDEYRGIDWSICYSKRDGSIIPIENDCTSYIYCLSELPLRIPCLFGLAFSSTADTCVPYQDSDCVVGRKKTTVKPKSHAGPTRGTCDNEIRAENKAACVGQPFGELVPYPGDCSKFLVCNCEYPTVKQCSGGLWFDNTIKVCNYPQNVHCDNSGGAATSSPATTAAPITTTPTTPITTTPTTPIATTPTETTPITTTPTEATPSTTISGGEWGNDCVAPEGMSADICLKYDDGFLLRYPYNCNAYINCTMGCPVMNYCQEDKVFNVLLKICDTPETAHCEELPMPPTTTTEKPTTTTEKPTTTTEQPTTTTEEPTTTTEEPTTTTEEPTTTTEEPTTTTEEPTTTTEEPTTTTEEPTTTTEDTTMTTPEVCITPDGINSNICLNQPEGSVQSYPYNCTAYITCRRECAYVEYCGPNNVYNPFLGICDAASNVECTEIPYPTPGTPTPTSSTSWPMSTTTEAPFSTTLPPDVNPELCSDESDYTVFPYAGNCGEYLMCMNGQVKVQECPNGWLFNAELKMCDQAGTEVCYTGITTTETPTTTTEPIYDLCIDQPKGASFPYPDDCQKYYYCRDNGTYYILSCPFNNYYDPYSGDCGPEVSPTACQVPMTTTTTTPATTTTLSPAEKCANQSSGVTFPYEEDCRLYIFCMGNDKYVIFSCPNNNYYYPDSGDCGPSSDEDICRKTTTTTSTTTTISTTITTTPTPSTVTTTRAPALQGICGNNTNGELIPYPDNCLKYISCVLPIPIGFYCPNNWYFDVDEQKCVPDANGTCSELPSNVTTTVAPPTDICQGQTAGDWQIYQPDCQMYYECLGDGFYMLQVCPQGTYFDPVMGKCSAEVGVNYCKQDFDTTTATTPVATTPKPQGICWEKPDGTLVPYPHECNKYIICDSPIPVGHNCPNGLQFSSDQQKCVEPMESDCGLITTPTTVPEPTPTMPVTECTGKPDYTLLPYEEDCAMFVICIRGLEHFAHCNNGQYFDVALGMCSNDGNKYSCLSDGTTTAVTLTTTDISNSTTEASSESSTASTTVDPNLGPCDGKPEGTKLPYPGNCEKYIECRTPIAVGHDCAEGLEFSADLGECVKPELANCSIKTTTEATTATTTPNTQESCENMPNGSTLTYPDDCSKYYLCLNGKSYLTNCMPGTYYNPANGQCDSMSATSCLETTTTTVTTEITTTTATGEGLCYDQPTGYTYPYSKDCSKYYMCLHGIPFVTECHPNTYYNPQTGECDGVTSSEACTGSSTTSEMTTMTTEVITTSTEKASTTTEQATTTEETTIKTPTPTTTTTETPSHGDNICCGKEHGTRLPYPGDKTKYITCKYPLPEISECPPNTQYDASTDQCKSDTALVDMPACANVSFGQALPYKGDCTKYYFCFGNQAMILTCANEWYFNGSLGSCVPSQLYHCPW